MATVNDFPLLVDVDWLRNNQDNVRILDATWSLPGDMASLPSGFIEGAMFFDLDEVATPHPTLKHMLPSKDIFEAAASDMGINSSDHIICYDRHGVFSSPRLWWTFRMFGHKKVSVLDGGLPAWIAAGFNVSDVETSYKKSAYEAASPLLKVTDKRGVLAALETDMQIIDARPSGRFKGTTPEPRHGLRSGHMPGAFNIPFGSLRTETLHFKDITKLLEIFSKVDPERPIITSYGSGVTAAGLAFTLARLGAEDITVYDGSWVDYGADKDVPIDKDNIA